MNVGILFEIIQWFTVKGDDTGLALSANQSPTLRNVSPLEEVRCLEQFLRRDPVAPSSCQEGLNVLHQHERSPRLLVSLDAVRLDAVHQPAQHRPVLQHSGEVLPVQLLPQHGAYPLDNILVRKWLKNV